MVSNHAFGLKPPRLLTASPRPDLGLVQRIERVNGHCVASPCRPVVACGANRLKRGSIVKIVYGSRHQGHAGAMEVNANRFVPMFEKPERMEQILGRLRETGFGTVMEADPHGLDAVHRIHDPGYVKFLETAWARWQSEGERRLRGLLRLRDARLEAGARPVDTLDAELLHLRQLCADHARHMGGDPQRRRCHAHRAEARQRGSARGLRAVPAAGAPCLAGPRGRLLLHQQCRRRRAGVPDKGASRVAILDVDYHHGNGTQRIFYERATYSSPRSMGGRRRNTHTCWASPTSAGQVPARAAI